MNEETLIRQKKEILEKKLIQNSNKKWRLLWAVFVTIVGTFLLPFMRMGNQWSRETFSMSIGYWNSVLLYGGLLFPIMLYLIHKEYSKMEKIKFDLEREMELLDKNILL